MKDEDEPVTPSNIEIFREKLGPLFNKISIQNTSQNKEGFDFNKFMQHIYNAYEEVRILKQVLLELNQSESSREVGDQAHPSIRAIDFYPSDASKADDSINQKTRHSKLNSICQQLSKESDRLCKDLLKEQELFHQIIAPLQNLGWALEKKNGILIADYSIEHLFVPSSKKSGNQASIAHIKVINGIPKINFADKSLKPQIFINGTCIVDIYAPNIQQNLPESIQPIDLALTRSQLSLISLKLFTAFADELNGKIAEFVITEYIPFQLIAYHPKKTPSLLNTIKLENEDVDAIKPGIKSSLEEKEFWKILLSRFFSMKSLLE